MPYPNLSELPPDVRRLSEERQRQWLAVFNDVYAETGSEEMAYAAAWGAVRKARATLKRTEFGPVVQGWGVLFTDAESPDLDDEFFDEATQTLLEYYPAAPLWMEHGYDKKYGPDPIGHRFDAKVFRHGIWAEHVLHTDHHLFDLTQKDVQDGRLAYSSDSIGHYVGQGYEENGYLSVWPLAGWSLTKNPAEPGLGPVSLKSFKSLLRTAEAQGAQGGALPEAQEAQRRPIRLVTTSRKDGEEMDILKMLKSFLGLDEEAALEAVQEGIDGLVETLTSDDEAMKSALSDEAVEAMKEAIGLDETETRADVATALKNFLALATGDEGEGEADGELDGQELDLGALKGMSNAWRANRRRAPYMVRAQDADDGQGQDDGAGKKRVHQNRGGRAEAGLIDLIAAKAGYEPPRFRGKPDAIQQAIKSATQLMPYVTQKAVSSGPSGGYWLREDIADEIIGPLYNEAVLFQAGARRRPMPNIMTLAIRKYNSGGSVYWGGEAEEGTDGRGTTDFVTLSLRKIVGESTLTEEELQFADEALEQQVTEDLVELLAVETDRSGLLGTGAKLTGHIGEEMLGLLNVPGVVNTGFSNLSTNGRTPAYKDLTTMKTNLHRRNIRMSDTWGYIFSHRTAGLIENMTDTNGNPLLAPWADPAEQRLRGIPWHATNQVPDDVEVGTNTDCSYIFLGDWKYLNIGVGGGVQLKVDPHIYVRKGLILIRAVMYIDVVVTRDEAFEIRAGVRE